MLIDIKALHDTSDVSDFFYKIVLDSSGPSKDNFHFDNEANIKTVIK